MNSEQPTAASRPVVHVLDDPERVASAAADRFVEIARLSSDSNGRFSVALSGGSTPKRVYELLSESPLRERVRWNDVHVFFGDERCVPPDHAESNYRMASEALLSRVPVPAENVHRIRGEGDAAANASLYEDEMRAYFAGADWPALDLVLLGLGDDGHTASLFPHTEALAERAAWVSANWVEKLGAFRVTLSASAINRASHVMFVVTGRSKSEALREVVEGEYDPARLPAQLVRPLGGSLEWFADDAAAAELSSNKSREVKSEKSGLKL